MQIAQIDAFLAVAELESFSLAAERLHITQPAVSKRIRQLENRVNGELFDRLGKRSILTPGGESFKPYAERIISELRAYHSSRALQLAEPSGKLTLATSHHIGLHRLPDVLREFKIRHPQVDLDLHFMDSEDACAAVAGNDVEIAVVTLPENRSDHLGLEPVWIDTLVAVMAVDHEIARSHAFSLEHLLDHPAILPSEGTFTRKIINTLFAEHRIPPLVTLETNYLETIKVMVSANLGWSILPSSMVDENLVAKPLTGISTSRPLGIVTRNKRTLSLSSLAMIDLLRSHRDSEVGLSVNPG